MRVLSVVGTRPNFMKIAPVAAELRRRGDRFSHLLVHTGQHYDDEMSAVFFTELGLPEPDFRLDVGSGSHTAQTARVMERLEPVLRAERPDVLLVPGDVNSTLAAALSAAQCGIRIGHVEAGLRSFDRTMPEELNREVVDALSELLFVHSPDARANLVHQGVDPEAIHDVGNTMIDTLVALRPHIEARDAPGRRGLPRGGYLLVTLHRPALVDGELLAEALAALEDVAAELPVVFPVHPRTQAAIEAAGLAAGAPHVRFEPAVGYLDFLSLLEGAAAVLTDSGGVQEESTYLGLPCFTLRDATERPVTVELGTNELLGLRPARIREIPERLRSASRRAASVPAGWDGGAAARIADVLEAVG